MTSAGSRSSPTPQPPPQMPPHTAEAAQTAQTRTAPPLLRGARATADRVAVLAAAAAAAAADGCAPGSMRSSTSGSSTDTRATQLRHALYRKLYLVQHLDQRSRPGSSPDDDVDVDDNENDASIDTTTSTNDDANDDAGADTASNDDLRGASSPADGVQRGYPHSVRHHQDRQMHHMHSRTQMDTSNDGPHSSSYTNSAGHQHRQNTENHHVQHPSYPHEHPHPQAQPADNVVHRNGARQMHPAYTNEHGYPGADHYSRAPPPHHQQQQQQQQHPMQPSSRSGSLPSLRTVNAPHLVRYRRPSVAVGDANEQQGNTNAPSHEYASGPSSRTYDRDDVMTWPPPTSDRVEYVHSPRLRGRLHPAQAMRREHDDWHHHYAPQHHPHPHHLHHAQHHGHHYGVPPVSVPPPPLQRHRMPLDGQQQMPGSPQVEPSSPVSPQAPPNAPNVGFDPNQPYPPHMYYHHHMSQRPMPEDIHAGRQEGGYPPSDGGAPLFRCLSCGVSFSTIKDHNPEECRQYRAPMPMSPESQPPSYSRHHYGDHYSAVQGGAGRHPGWAEIPPGSTEWYGRQQPPPQMQDPAVQHDGMPVDARQGDYFDAHGRPYHYDEYQSARYGYPPLRHHPRYMPTPSSSVALTPSSPVQDGGGNSSNRQNDNTLRVATSSAVSDTAPGYGHTMSLPCRVESHVGGGGSGEEPYRPVSSSVVHSKDYRWDNADGSVDIKRGYGRSPPSTSVASGSWGGFPWHSNPTSTERAGELSTGGSLESAASDGSDDNQAGTALDGFKLRCYNCHTTTTPMWRRDLEGNTTCNACGLYFKLHNINRPKHLRRSVIKRRHRGRSKNTSGVTDLAKKLSSSSTFFNSINIRKMGSEDEVAAVRSSTSQNNEETVSVDDGNDVSNNHKVVANAESPTAKNSSHVHADVDSAIMDSNEYTSPQNEKSDHTAESAIELSNDTKSSPHSRYNDSAMVLEVTQ